MARNSFKRDLLTRIQEERERRGVSGAAFLLERSETAPNPRHMIAFSSDDLPALRSGRRPAHTAPGQSPQAPAPAQPAPGERPASS
jgi:hypothetical protein